MADPVTLESLRERLLEQADKLADIRSKPAEERAKFAEDARLAIEAINLLDAEYTARGAAQRAIPPAQPVAATRTLGVQRPRSVGEIVVSGDDYAAWATNVRRGPYAVNVEARDREIWFAEREVPDVRALLDEANSASTGALNFLPVGTPYLNAASVDRRRLFIEDLLASGTTTLSSVPYIRELNPRTTETAATTVAEGASKPEVAADFAREDAPVRKVAAWIPATDEVLADAPTLRSYIDDRLRYMLRVRREAEILSGNGVSPDLTGILNTSGIQTQSATAGDYASTLANAIALVEEVDLDPDGIAMTPTNFWTMASRRTSTSGEFDVINFQDPVAPRIWGLPVVRTRSMTANHALVGAFRLGAQVLEREGINLRVGDQHSDYFVKNILVILAETRLALAVHRPDAFVDATLA